MRTAIVSDAEEKVPTKSAAIAACDVAMAQAEAKIAQMVVCQQSKNHRLHRGLIP
jgi:hypothetical protein